MNNVLINCVALNKAYKQAEEKLEVLKNLNFTVKKGESVGLIGASGCGKSTLLHVLAGLDLPDSGEVNFNDSNMESIASDKHSIIRRPRVGQVYPRGVMGN